MPKFEKDKIKRIRTQRMETMRIPIKRFCGWVGRWAISAFAQPICFHAFSASSDFEVNYIYEIAVILNALKLWCVISKFSPSQVYRNGYFGGEIFTSIARRPWPLQKDRKIVITKIPKTSQQEKLQSNIMNLQILKKDTSYTLSHIIHDILLKP